MPGWPELSGAPETVAPRLLGAVLVGRGVAIRITEVEAYGGSEDAGSHAARGPTPRTASMFEDAGHLYCYRIYGLHVCANVVTGVRGSGAAVLLRAGEVVAGLELAQERRPGASRRDLARGPANLCRASGLVHADDGLLLRDGGGDLSLTLAAHPVPPSTILAGPRVGLRRAASIDWRFRVAEDPTVSSYRRHRGADEGPGSAS